MKRRITLLACLLLILCLLPMEGLAVRYGQVVRITHHVSLNVRSGPGTSYGVIGEVQPENIYPYLGTENGWNRIRYTGGVEGYVSGNKTTIEDGLVPDELGTGQLVEAIVRITHTNTLNIRSGPGKSYGVIGVANPNDTYPYLGPDDGWNMIRYTNGQVGYVAGNRSEVEVVGVMAGDSIAPETDGTSGATGTTDIAFACSQCDGNGVCTTCEGSGFVYGAVQQNFIECPSCLRLGTCWRCQGDGIQ